MGSELQALNQSLSMVETPTLSRVKKTKSESDKK